MNFRRIWGNLSLFQKNDGAHHSAGAQKSHDVLVDVLFDKQVKEEARLQELLEAYKRSRKQGSKQSEGAGQELFIEFKALYGAWTPDETIFSDPDALIKAPPQSFHADLLDSHQPGQKQAATLWVIGCRGGHPKELLGVLAFALEQVPLALGEVTAREGESGQKVASSTLEAIQVAVLSHHNCRVLMSLGMLASLSQVMKVAISKLNTIAAKLSAGDEVPAAQLKHLQLHVAQAAAVLLTVAKVEAEACIHRSKPLVDRFELRGGVQYCAGVAREPVTPEEANAMDFAFQPLVSCQMIPLLWKVLRLLAPLRHAGFAEAVELQEALLKCLLAIVSASRPAASQLYDRDSDACGLLVLLEDLGANSQGGTSAAGRLGPARELRTQLLLLQTVGAAIKRNSRNLLLYKESGGAAKVQKLLAWIVATFSACPDGSKPQSYWPVPPTWASAKPTAPTELKKPSTVKVSSFKGSSKNSQRKSVRFEDGSSPRGAGTSIKFEEKQALTGPWEGGGSGIPQSQELREVFWVLESWLHPRVNVDPQDLDHWDRVLAEVVRAVFGSFTSTTTAGNEALRDNISALQHYTLTFISHMLETNPSALPSLRMLGYLDLLFGPYFFFLGQSMQQDRVSPLERLICGLKHDSSDRLQQASTITLNCITDELAGTVAVSIKMNTPPSVATGSDTGHLDADAMPRGPKVDAEILRTLRWRVVHLTEQAAGMVEGGSNEPECQRLVELLSQRVMEAEVVLAAAPGLGRILLAQKEATLRALERLDVLTVLARGIVKQQQLQEAAQVVLHSSRKHTVGAELPEEVTFSESRFALLHLLESLLYASPGLQRRAVRTWDIVAAVFGLLHHSSTRQVALRIVVGLMRMEPSSEDDALAKTALFTKYIEILPTALQDRRKEGLGMVFDLLTGIQRVVAANPPLHQNLFRKAECFVQIVNLLNLEYEADMGSQMCCHVLATLMTLLAGNEASRARMRDDVGYDTLYAIIGRLVGHQGPSQALLLQLLALVLEKEWREGGTGQVIANTNAVQLMFRCMRESQPPLQEQLLRIWQQLVLGNMANLSACERADVNSLLVDWLAASVGKLEIQAEIARLLELTGAYSIKGRDLRAVFSLLRPIPASEGGRVLVPQHSQLLLRSLATMAQHEGPAAFFDFANQSAGLMRSSSLKFPGSKGYTFATWLRLERVVFDPHTAGQSLFCLLSDHNGAVKGVSASLQGDKLILYCVAPKPAEVVLKFNFQAKMWYHLAITHSSGGPLTPSTVRLFINGEQRSGARFRFPKVTEPLNECSIGAKLNSRESGLGRPLAALSGQMGCIYLFEDILSAAQVAALCELGPDYQSTFMATESDPAFDQAAQAAARVVMGKEALGPVLLMSYNAQAAAGRMLYDTSDMEKGANKEGGPAAMLEGTQLCCTCQLRDILHCLGGVAALLPLLAQLDIPDVEEGPGISRAVDVVNLFSAVLEESPSNRQSMMQISGVALMSQLLQQIAPSHLTVELLKAIEGLCHASRPAEQLRMEISGRLILNFKLWSRAPVSTQRYLLQFLVNFAKAQPSIFRSLLNVPQLLDAVRAHFWVHPSHDAVKPAAGGRGIGDMEIRDLRRGVLHIARILLRQSVQPGNWHARSTWADMQAFVSFIGDCSEVEMLEDVLTGLSDALHPGSPTQGPLVACLRAHGGERLFLPLLQREQESLRLLGLQLLMAFQSPKKPTSGETSGSGKGSPGLDDLKQHGFWTSVSDLVLMFPLTAPTRAVLLEMLCTGTQPVQVRGAAAVPIISCAPVLGILLRLSVGCTDSHERLSVLEALHHLCVEGPKENRARIVEHREWEEWVLELLLDASQSVKANEAGSQDSQTDPNPDQDANVATAEEEQLQSRLAAADSAGPGPSSDRLSNEATGMRRHQSAPQAAGSRDSSKGLGTSIRSLSMESDVSRNRSSASDDGGRWRWPNKETHLLRGILRALHLHCIQHLQNGWTVLQRTAFRLRQLSALGKVDGLGLMHALLADVMKDLISSASTEQTQADNWLLVTSLSASPGRSNATGLLVLVEQLAAGCLIPAGAVQSLNPSPEAMRWAEHGDGGEVGKFVWAGLGLLESEALHVLPTAWHLYDLSWQLMYILHRTADDHAAPQAQEGSRPRVASLPSSSSRAPQTHSIFPLGIDRRLASLPVFGRSEGVASDEDDAEHLATLSMRLIMRLLVKYLRYAPLKSAETCANNALHLLPAVADPSRKTFRGHWHLMMAALVVCLGLVSDASGQADRENLLCSTIQALVRAGQQVYSAAHLPQPQLPPLEDPQFRLVMEGSLLTEKVASAARAEILAMQRIAKGHLHKAQLLEAHIASRSMHERQLRQNMQEDARQALGLIHSSEKSRRGSSRVAMEEEAQTLARSWRSIWRSLSGPSGLWAPHSSPEDLHWKLDKFEDASRRRMKMKLNYKFQMYRQPSKAIVPSSVDKPPEPLPLPGVKRRICGIADDDDALSEAAGQHSESDAPLHPEQARGSQSGALLRTVSEESLTAREEGGAHDAELAEDLQKVLYTTSCQLVSAKQVTFGTLRVTPSQLHFSGDPEGEVGQQSPEKSKAVRRKYKRWPVGAVVEVHHARFLLRPFALEIFLTDRSNALLSFSSAEIAREVARHLQRLGSNIAIYDRKRKQEMAQKLQQLWQRWEMTNFDYIMQLNTLAGRSYNDLNQYPVFPWILADYVSEAVDLNDAASFRDLSKPVGALDQKRLAFFLERYEGLKTDPDTPPFHYGSHYSSAAIVLFYLLRLEPFTLLNRNLQGGRFDHADRLFHSVAETWESSLHNTTDVKELTPEFFYQPEFLLNSNSFMLGQRQDGSFLGDVVLPPWARNSADEFVRIQREALESAYVSEHLHEWLDLIFGVKQHGRAAEEACNVFYYLTYEGAVDLEEISDPLQRKAVEDQICFFGQTPSPLFRRRHAKRGPPPLISHPLLCGEALKLAVVGKPPACRKNSAVAELAVTEGRVVLVNADRAVSCHRWLSPKDQTAFTFSGIGEATYSVEPDAALPRLMGDPLAADLGCGKCFCVLPGGQVIVSCGYWDNSIRCYSVDDGRLLQSLRHHKDVVTCLALGSNGATLVSGSRDTTVIVWEASTVARGKTRGRSAGPLLPLHPHPRHVLYGHSDAVVCAAISPDQNLVISGGADGSMLYHAAASGRHVLTHHLPGGVAVSMLAFADRGGILVAHSLEDLSLHAFTLNGRHVASFEGNERLSSLHVSPDGRVLLTGGAKGFVTLHWLHSLKVVLRCDPQRGPVSAVVVTAEECILAGLSDGSLLVFAPDPKGRQTLNRRHELGIARPSDSGLPPTLKFE